MTNPEKAVSFSEKVTFLEQEGHWSDDLADCLPLAVSNMLMRPVKIYCSNRSCPVYEIQPSIPAENFDSVLQLAYLQIPGHEHYDACIPIGQEGTPGDIYHEKSDTATCQPTNLTTSESSANITPRKQADYTSPRKFTSTRKRKANPEKRKKNIRKQRRLHGLSYISATGKEIGQKEVKTVKCKCRFKWTDKLSEAKRLEYFSSYWQLDTYERQRDFICANISERSPERLRSAARRRRATSRAYYFERNRVCKLFFLKTLDIGERVVESALKSKNSGTFSSIDKRGKHSPHNKTPNHMLDEVRKHIESFPVLDAHYTRQDTNRKFLGQDLNIRKMYLLYKDFTKAQNKKCVSNGKYRQIFCNEYNYSFHIPKKDQCLTCVVYHQKEQTGEMTPIIKANYDNHCKNKERAREEKRSDKMKAKNSKNYHVATFDLQAVLPIPCSLVSQVYYKRKLSCYNLSFYSLKDSHVTCYLWNESEGKRGSCEIGTCLLTYIKSLPSNIEHVTFYSDCCSGQNRNKFTASLLLHAINSVNSVSIIDHKFLESGHTQMESDSVHAAIERAKKCTSIYVPSQWDTVVRLARRKKPYTVVPMKFFDFLNLKPLANSVLPQNIIDSNGEKVQWMKIKWLQFRKTDPQSVFYKYHFDGDFHSVNIKMSRKKISITASLPQLYTTKLPISSAKKADLLSLCKDGTIPTEFHSYFTVLSDNKMAKDCLPDPDLIEDDEDSNLE